MRLPLRQRVLPRCHERLVRRAALGAFVAVAAACGDGAGGPVSASPITLCLLTDWLAYRNERGAWTRVSSSTGAFAFKATSRLAIAWARVDPRAPMLRVEYLTAEQARATYPCAMGPTAVPGTVSGTVQGLADGDYLDVTHGRFGRATTSWTEPVFSLFAFEGTNDLVATRFPTRVSADRIDRIVLRRAQSYTAGSTVALDFASAEAFAPAERRLRWTGPRASVQVNFVTATGNDHVLQSTILGSVGAGDQVVDATIYTLPASRLATGDVHQVAIGDGVRQVVHYMRTLRDVTASFGPAANEPVFATVATAPRARVRATVQSQPEYDAFATLQIQQPNAAGTARLAVTITATREHFGGTPDAWPLELPDLSAIDGWDDVLALGDREFEWTLNVSGRSPYFSPRDAADGLVLRGASTKGRRRP
jgi:hypothetical protein